MKRINLKPLASFLKSGSAGGVLLLVAVITSLLIANSSWNTVLDEILHQSIGGIVLNVDLEYTIIEWINDGLMAIFFLLVGLEIKRNLIEGELSTFKKASLPVIAALGGAVAPAIIFIVINKGTSSQAGWGIPMATDIAFALAVITLLGDRVPLSVKIFLSALAIADDLFAIVVIAVFYSSGIAYLNLIIAAGIFLLLLAFNHFGIKRLVFYIIPGLFMWYFIHHSGIHATIAGVLTALTLPTTPDATESPLEKLEHLLSKPVNFVIMPLFALANTNIQISSSVFDHITSPVTIGIAAGLLIGKPIGIILASWVSVKSGLSVLPHGSNWRQLLGVGLLGGIGFTMSIFIAVLSFKENPLLLTQSKFSILLVSLISGVIGYLWLFIQSRQIQNP